MSFKLWLLEQSTYCLDKLGWSKLLGFNPVEKKIIRVEEAARRLGRTYFGVSC